MLWDYLKTLIMLPEGLIFDKYRPCLQPAHMHGDCNVKRDPPDNWPSGNRAA
jgi:hypothetical protein